MIRILKKIFSKKESSGLFSISKKSLRTIAKKSNIDPKLMDQAFDSLVEEIEASGGSIDLRSPTSKKMDEIPCITEYIKRMRDKYKDDEITNNYIDVLLKLTDLEFSYFWDCVSTYKEDKKPIIRNYEREYYFEYKAYNSKNIIESLYKSGIFIESTESDSIEDILQNYKVSELKSLASRNLIEVKGKRNEIVDTLILNKEKILKDIHFSDYLKIPFEIVNLIVEAADMQSKDIGLVNAQFNKEQLDGLGESDFVEYKGWLTSRDNWVCDECKKMDDEIVPLNETFSNGEMYPNSQHCKRGCRCTIIPSNKN
ncbi:hypothetical protein ISS37_05160 [candidate division KSB1 bacterium]|nr:hypothetical protein [candidate division KSB1 bacterium]